MYNGRKRKLNYFRNSKFYYGLDIYIYTNFNN